MPREIQRTEVEQLLARGVPLIEVLSEKAFREMHIAGAINIPLESLNRETTASLNRESPVMVYCHDPQ